MTAIEKRRVASAYTELLFDLTCVFFVFVVAFKFDDTTAFFKLMAWWGAITFTQIAWEIRDLRKSGVR